MPNFGMDHDIIVSQANEAASQEKLKHTWNWSPALNEEEIKDKALIRWGSLAQRNPASLAVSDPICSSAGCPNSWKGRQADKPVNYPVTHGYPLDDDIISTQGHLKNQEVKQKHVWKLPETK